MFQFIKQHSSLNKLVVGIVPGITFGIVLPEDGIYACKAIWDASEEVEIEH